MKRVMVRFGLGWLLLIGLTVHAADDKPIAAPKAIAGLESQHKGPADLMWFADLAPAIEDALKNNRLLLIDFTGVTCTNCRLNEKDNFPKAEAKAALNQLTRVSLYTDEIPAKYFVKDPGDEVREDRAIDFRNFQKTAFKTNQLPFYVLVKPLKDHQFSVVSIYKEGRITDDKAFVEFLTTKAK